MSGGIRTGRSRWRKVAKAAGGAAAGLVLVAATFHVAHMMNPHAHRPEPSEFGLGPRVSAAGTYTASLEPVQPLRTRKMQEVRVKLVDAEGRPVDAASITLDGGMPEHGHGLPTRPRVTRRVGPGTWEIDGLKFNMGGWWELRFAISAAAGADTVTFNIDL